MWPSFFGCMIDGEEGADPVIPPLTFYILAV